MFWEFVLILSIYCKGYFFVLSNGQEPCIWYDLPIVGQPSLL